jgi:hypothetical protein
VFNANLKAVSLHPWTATIIDWIGGHEITDSLSSFKDGCRLGAVHGVVVISLIHGPATHSLNVTFKGGM